jgi:hypothetical protein
MISELRTFVYKNGRPDHMEGYHDDIIMAFAMAIFIVQTSFKKLEQVEKQTKAMLESWVNVSNNQSKPLINDNNTLIPFIVIHQRIILNKIMVIMIMVNTTGYSELNRL